MLDAVPILLTKIPFTEYSYPVQGTEVLNTDKSLTHFVAFSRTL